MLETAMEMVEMISPSSRKRAHKSFRFHLKIFLILKERKYQNEHQTVKTVE